MMKIEITEKEYKELLKSQSKLTSLENGGVDNWEFYEDALDEFLKDENFNENVDAFVDEILTTVSEFTYEPSERGAGFAVSENGGFELEKLIKKTVKEFKSLPEQEQSNE